MAAQVNLREYTGNRPGLLAMRAAIIQRGAELFAAGSEYDFCPVSAEDDSKGYILLKQGVRAYDLVPAEKGELACTCESFKKWAMCKHEIGISAQIAKESEGWRPNRVVIVSLVETVIEHDNFPGCSTLKSQISRADQDEIEEMLALAELGIKCYQCGKQSTFLALGQPWCSFECSEEIRRAFEPEPDIERSRAKKLLSELDW